MRRRLLLVALAVPLATAAIAHGCSDEQPFESVCDWLNDPNNCYRDFHEDMMATAGPDNPNGDCRTWSPSLTAATDIPTQATGIGPGVSNGSFVMREKLDMCILNAGGTVAFDPPIDLTMFPPSIFADPITYTITITNPNGDPCGTMTYTSPHGFSVTINPPPDAGTTAVNDAGPAVFPDGGDAGTGLAFGTYTQTFAPGRDAFDVTCPTGEAHHFNLDEILGPPGEDGGATSQCAALVNVIPAASLQIFLGGVDTAGGLSFAITWPPTNFAEGVPYFPDGGPTAADGGVIADTAVVYFNCAIPGAMETCADGVKNSFETDIDCGGPQQPSMDFCTSCPLRCEVGQQCLCDADCDVAGGLQCTTNPMSGARQCEVPDAGTSDAGPHHFPTCSWNTDAGAPCDGG
jgi:hypothetical protein